jgi:bacteriorhodopsin
MKLSDIKLVFYLIGLGASLIVYAHSTFTTKDVATDIKDDVKEIREDVKYIKNYLLEIK